MDRTDVLVVGGGIVGLATARAVLRSNPDRSVTVIEKEGSVAAHQSGRNSGVIHAGVYYQPGSYKAQLCTAGRVAMVAYCREHGIPCAIVRVISDTASEDLPLDFNALSKPDKNLDFGKLFLAIAKSPGKIGALMELQKKTKFAAENLARVLAKLI